MYLKNIEEVLKEFSTNEKGLTMMQVEEARAKYGMNEISDKDKKSVLSLFVDALKDPLVIVLIIAAVVQFVLGEVVESLIIVAVIILNAILSVTQTLKAESSLDSLKKLSTPNAKVIRDGANVTIKSTELVPGDIITVEAGDSIPADGRLIVSESLKIVEGMLTGESLPVEKDIKTLDKEVGIGDRINMVFSGSMVVYGRGKFVVTATGDNTEMGRVANLIRTAESKSTPLQLTLEDFSKKLGVGILILSLAIFGIQVFRAYMNAGAQAGGMSRVVLDSFMFAVAIAVAAIPEALSSIVTIVLAVGTKNMARRNAVIRKLPAVETLGSATVICSDKTGTLTQNKMTVTDYYLYNDDSSGVGKEHEIALTFAYSLCNDSYISDEGKEVGDPTEVAFLNFAKSRNINYLNIRDENIRVGELPFDSDRKMMSTVNKIESDAIMFTKGAPDVILSRCKYAYVDNKAVKMTDEIADAYRRKNEEFSNRALRVLAFAAKDVPDENFVPTLKDEYELVLIGLMAMIDPPREAVIDAVEDAQSAGIKVVMITGDHKTTARAIAKEIDIYKDGDMALTGKELDDLSEVELTKNLESISVYARVSPENKIRIVKAWQSKENIVAMTGDGVNDAPALKQANIGIAMGSGTEVAKDASSMILTDDNFASIIAAVEVGRTVYNNIIKAITYLFAGNLAAIITIIYAVFANLPNPFTPLQLLFINLVNDSLPAIALGLEPTEGNEMKRRPRDSKASIFSGGTLKNILVRGFIMGIIVIIGLYIGLRANNESAVAMAFSTLIMCRILQTIPARSNDSFVHRIGFFSNKYVLMAVGVCFLLFFITLIPGVRGIFDIPDSFDLGQLGIAFALAVVSTLVIEGTKVFRRKK